jgi:hypothetical protein
MTISQAENNVSSWNLSCEQLLIKICAHLELIYYNGVYSNNLPTDYAKSSDLSVNVNVNPNDYVTTVNPQTLIDINEKLGTFESGKTVQTQLKILTDFKDTVSTDILGV